jgi:hypothetical protein
MTGDVVDLRGAVPPTLADVATDARGCFVLW